LMAATDMTDADLPKMIGHLVVTYQIEFTTPNLNARGGNGGQVMYVAGGGMTYSAPFTAMLDEGVWDDAVDPDYRVPDDFDVKFENDSNIHLPAGYYSMDLYAHGGVTEGPKTSVTAVGNWAVTYFGGARELKIGTSRSSSAKYQSDGYHALWTGLVAVPDGGYMHAQLTQGSGIDIVQARFQCLGGHLPYIAENQQLSAILASLQNGEKIPKMKWMSPRPRFRSTISQEKRQLCLARRRKLEAEKQELLKWATPTVTSSVTTPETSTVVIIPQSTSSSSSSSSSSSTSSMLVSRRH